MPRVVGILIVALVTVSVSLYLTLEFKGFLHLLLGKSGGGGCLGSCIHGILHALGVANEEALCLAYAVDAYA